MLPLRDATSHKGTHGTLVCLAGSLEYAGAALLCGLAGARGGAGLVALAVPVSIQPVVAGRVPELITVGLPLAADGDIEPVGAQAAIEARSAEAMVIGPGLHESAGNAALVAGLVASPGGPAVVDGGALNLLARRTEWWPAVRRALVLTPHPGELQRLTGAPPDATGDQRQRHARDAAERFGHVVVLKGAGTLIASPDGRMALSPFANAALASAGSGDVLAGLIGSLLAQGVAPFEAACLGVYLHGRAGERLSERLGDAGLIASDLPFEAAVARRELTEVRVG
ncbi:hypothetical protein BH24CHL5_BH24CHL5_06480 [soil metagenome]